MTSRELTSNSEKTQQSRTSASQKRKWYQHVHREINSEVQHLFCSAYKLLSFRAQPTRRQNGWSKFTFLVAEIVSVSNNLSAQSVIVTAHISKRNYGHLLFSVSQKHLDLWKWNWLEIVLHMRLKQTFGSTCQMVKSDRFPVICGPCEHALRLLNRCSIRT